MELESKAKDPSRLMNARGSTLLMEEKEQNKVRFVVSQSVSIQFSQGEQTAT